MRAILGISDTHNAAAACIDGCGMLRALQEERPTRRKNFSGFPRRSIAWLLESAGLAADGIDTVAMAGLHRPPFKTREELVREFRNVDSLASGLKRVLRPTPIFTVRKLLTRHERLAALRELDFRVENIRFYEHHLCHAATAYYGWGRLDEPILIITCDGGGDGLCGTISVGTGGEIERLHSIPWDDSIALLYATVTYLTGMVPLEHEYKIMGLAPYAKEPAAERLASKLEGLFRWSEDGAPVWTRAPGVPHMYYIKPVLEALFFEERFDSVMAGTQLFTERMLRELVRRAAARTGIRKVALAGGIFMNVKANKEILAIPEIEDLFVFPSCGDETNAIGACYLALADERGGRSVPRLGDFYLGPEWDDDALRAALDRDAGQSVLVETPADINQTVAELLARGEVVARFAGREEFGARSLGNRAILADPRNPEVVKVINEMIKNRDFWMPFAASVLDSYEPRYLDNPKGVASPYMILSFDTTEDGAAQLRAGTHPYDRTCRPQVVTREQNPSYWDLIDKFARLTGVGGVLNTSLNLHGHPLVHTPDDALEVLRESGLKYLACGPYLVRGTRTRRTAPEAGGRLGTTTATEHTAPE